MDDMDYEILSIIEFKEDLLDFIVKNQILDDEDSTVSGLLVGEGKPVGMTQPRRVAAISVAAI